MTIERMTTAEPGRDVAYFAGVLCANSLPHLAIAAAGKRPFPPVTGRRSNRWFNLGWGVLNLTGGLVLAARGRTWRRRGTDRFAFESGAATFTAWFLASKTMTRVNVPPELVR